MVRGAAFSSDLSSPDALTYTKLKSTFLLFSPQLLTMLALALGKVGGPTVEQARLPCHAALKAPRIVCSGLQSIINFSVFLLKR